MATFEIHQIKEKFGGLRFYWNCVGNSADINNIHGAVAIIESLATSFCEVCGSNVEVKTRASKDKYWIRTLCQTHRQQDELAKGTT